MIVHGNKSCLPVCLVSLVSLAKKHIVIRVLENDFFGHLCTP